MKAPSPFGDFSLSLQLPAVSQQARAEHRVAFQAFVRDVTKTYEFLLSGDVSVSVEWIVAERIRYETDRTPDVDNILKPLLDALTGPNGVLIDDNQVQHVSCSWINSDTNSESLSVTLRYAPDEWLSKAGLYFVQLQDALCVPLSHNTPAEFQQEVVNVYESALAHRERGLALGIDSGVAGLCMPTQRVYHRSRLRGFDVVMVDAFRSRNGS